MYLGPRVKIWHSQFPKRRYTIHKKCKISILIFFIVLSLAFCKCRNVQKRFSIVDNREISLWFRQSRSLWIGPSRVTDFYGNRVGHHIRNEELLLANVTNVYFKTDIVSKKLITTTLIINLVGSLKEYSLSGGKLL